jgi:hypothetical protein
LLLVALPLFPTSEAAEPKVSEATEECLGCHVTIHPGLVADWKLSRHARTTPAYALEKPQLARRLSAATLPANLSGHVVGCAECHTLNADRHKDTFEHGGRSVHIVVTPEDCAVCHPNERTQYAANIMSRAHGNLVNNPLYADLERSIAGPQAYHDGALMQTAPETLTRQDSCLHCHGTSVGVEGQETRETVLGEMIFPVLSGWPNQGVGRVNPDGSLGSCAACHTRHTFSIEMARRPATCSECHKGPDVPAYPVYRVSKHGNIYASMSKGWDFDAVPWSVGEDFTAPTCATCHVSLLVDGDGEVIAERTHKMSDRLAWRIFGLPFAHPQPKSPDTTKIRNAAGLPLPTELTGQPAAEFLIGVEEQTARRETMKRVCRSCHGSSWVEGHLERLDNTIRTTNAMTLAATGILSEAWESGAAAGPGQQAIPFDEPLEKMWVEQWLFYANSTRFASAMAGADYGVFANGRWALSRNLREMADWLARHEAIAGQSSTGKAVTARPTSATGSAGGK